MSSPTSENVPAMDPVTKKEEESMEPAEDLSRTQTSDTVSQEDEPNTLTQTKSLEKRVSLPREILVVGIICLAQFTTQVGLGQMLSIIHVVSDSFNVTNAGTQSWLIAGYSLTVGTFILISGRCGDMFGYKRMLVIGYVWFALWSIIAGVAVYSNKVLFIFARVFQGIGPSICLPNGLALLGVLYQPGKRKNMAFAMFGACAPGGAIVGSAFAALFALAWWPWAFWSFGIALGVIALAGATLIPDPQQRAGCEGKTWRDLPADMDLLGAGTGITGLILFNFAWNQAPISGWDSFVLCPLILGLIFIAAFFYIEIKVASHPLIPFEALTGDNAFVLGCVACGWACFGIFIYYLWQFLLTLRGASPLLASAYLSPFTVSGAVAAIVTGFLLSRLHPATVMILALTFFLIGTILIATCDVHQIYWGQIFVTTIVAPWGMDMSFPAATLVISNSVKKEHQGVAASLVTTVVNYSISLGLGFAGTVEIHVNDGGKTPRDILKGYRGAWYMGIGLAGLGMGLAVLFRLKAYLKDRRQVDKNSAAEKGGLSEGNAQSSHD